MFCGGMVFFLKVGTDSPENLLGYFEFDGTYDAGGFSDLQPDTADRLHHYPDHRADWRDGDPTWGGAANKGKNLIGALNYLAREGKCGGFVLLGRPFHRVAGVWCCRGGETGGGEKRCHWSVQPLPHADRVAICTAAHVRALSSPGQNAVSFLTYNWGGDGRDVWPFIRGEARSVHYVF